jgi:tetratricopeptide (TPR) repeat protein
LQGVAAGERSIPAEMFQNPQTPFWAVVSTRPYMRSLFGLGQTLEELERIDEAIEVFQKLLRLNANDNQGVRFILVPLLIEENRDKEADQLLNQYESPMASCVYAKALIAFRVKGDSPEARLALRMAFKTNRYVPKYLREGVPTYRLSRFELGGPDEAVVASHQLSYVFELTPGALEWIESEFRAWRQEMRRTSRKKSKNRRRRNT